MSIVWNTPAGRIDILQERVYTEIPLNASTTQPSTSIEYSLISGSLPRGMRLSNTGVIKGSPVEEFKYTSFRFVIRADDGLDVIDRTFSIDIDGYDEPYWVTREGFLNVGPAQAYYVLDNSYVNYQLEADDAALSLGVKLSYSLTPNSGELPPGLDLSKDGVISGFTDPIFAVQYTTNPNGSYDTIPYDYMPIDLVNVHTNGWDTYWFDNTVYDYSLEIRTPKHLSRVYTFGITVTDGVDSVNRVFKIYVVTEEFLNADNTLLEVDTNLFQASSSGYRVPQWITPANLGEHRANNYLTIFTQVYNPPSLGGYISYFMLPNNIDGSISELPLGMQLDQLTGEIAGRVPYQPAISKTYSFTMVAVYFPLTLANQEYNLRGDWDGVTTYFVGDAVRYNGFIWVCLIENKNQIPADGAFWNRGVSTAERTFTITLIGEIESVINWISDSNCGTIKPNQPSVLHVIAENQLYDGSIVYDFVSGKLPPGLEFLSNGLIQGKVKQFADSQGPGLLRFTDNTTFDGVTTSFDRKFNFTIRARDTSHFAESSKNFYITVSAENSKTFANLYVKALQSKEKRLSWFNFITDSTIFKPTDLYRYGDVNFGVQSDLKMLVYAGIESVEAVKYVQAMSRNHYRKRLKFGDLKTAKAKDPLTQETIYEVIYVDIVDEYEKNNKSISKDVQLPRSINSPILISYDAIKVDSNIPLASYRDHQHIYPNSIKNMRKRIAEVGEKDREFLPLWMRSVQDEASYEPGFTKALVLCYSNPGTSSKIMARIRASNFDFKTIDFVADRYLIDIIDGQIQDKYLAFPQRGEKLP